MGCHGKVKMARGGLRGKSKCAIYIKYLLVLAAVLAFCVFADRAARERAVPKTDGDFVRIEELAGYLQVIPLTPEETRSLIVDRLGGGDEAALTGEDVAWLLEYLKLGELSEMAGKEIPLDGSGAVTRESWDTLYGEMLSTLGLEGEVEIIDIQYLGMLLQDGHLMADTGNYICDTEGIDFTYGETYRVYVWGNILLGRAAPETGDGADGGDAGETADGKDESTDVSDLFLPENVRVLLTQDNAEKIYRENVYLKGEVELSVSPGNETVAAGQILNCLDWMEQHDTDEMEVSLPDGSASLSEDADGRIVMTDENGTAVSSAYAGAFYIYKDGNGLRVVNEVSLEAYLCGVVPGEMPERFAKEALKAQAVCARTYAARLVSGEKYGEYGANLIDTTDCQVYLPSQENEKASEAVRETAGQVLTADGALADIYYFSTSCGLTSGLEVWQTGGRDYLTTVSLLTESLSKVLPKSGLTVVETAYAASADEDAAPGGVSSYDDFLRRTDVSAYDSHSRYFRWTATVDTENCLAQLKDALQAEIEKGTGRVGVEDTDGTGIVSVDNLGALTGMEIISRNAAGMATDLALVFDNGRVHLYHENAIRTVLGAAMTALTDKNGESVNTLTMLPSAAFSADVSGGRMVLYGGGLGHGIGMSQYGADGMAQAGMEYGEILATFFPGTVLR